MKVKDLKKIIKEIVKQNFIVEISSRKTFDDMSIYDYKRLKREYERAIGLGLDKFNFDGREVLVEYAKYLLRFLELKFREQLFRGKNKIKEADDDDYYVEYVKDKQGEKPFILQGKKFQYVWAKYPSGKIDIGVYAYAGDLVYGYKAFREKYNLP